MPLKQVWALIKYWERQPPTYQAVGIIARMLGWKPAETAEDRQRNADEFRRLAGLPLPASLATGGMPAPVLDLDAFRQKHRERQIEIAMANAAVAG